MKLSLPLFLFAAVTSPVHAFVSSSQEGRSLLSSSLSAGKGMGMGATAASKKKTNGGKKNGMGKANNGAKVAPFDVNASLIRLEKRYDEIMKAAAKQLASDDDSFDEKFTREYIIAARAATKQGVRDWVPVAQLCLARPNNEYDKVEEILQNAISTYCREMSHVAAFGAPVFKTVARNDVQYSIESMDSFHKFVYESVVEGGSDKDITKAEARETLNVDATSEKAAIKQAYRKLSFELHPDRFQGTPEECEEAAVRFARVKLAYDTLNSGVRGEDGSSWYESLGGRARTEFVGPVNLLPLAAAQEQIQRKQVDCAIVGLSPEMIQTFVARNLKSQ